MGFCVSYAAFRSANKDAVLKNLRLEEKAASGSLLDEEIAGVPLVSGGYLVFARDPLFFGEGGCFLEESWGPDVIWCSALETTMSFYAASFRGGVELWSVAHDAQIALEHLDVQGTPPAVLQELREVAAKRQANENEDDPLSVDHFSDIPVDLVGSLTGFRYDSFGGYADDQVMVLQRT
ncbi:MAG: hypothetical protein AAGH41_06515 [Pseudomonadota bacterium]